MKSDQNEKTLKSFNRSEAQSQSHINLGCFLNKIDSNN